MNFYDYFNGITAVINVLFGFSAGFYFLIKYMKTKKGLLPLVGLLMITLGSFYLGPATSFGFLLFGKNILGNVYAYLSYTSTPLAMIFAMILGFNIFKTEWRFKILWIFIPIAILFWIFFYIFPDMSFIYTLEPVDPEFTEQLMDISFIGVLLVINAFYILGSVAVLGGGFFILSRKIKGTAEFKKAIALGIGWIFFGISGALDALLSEIYPFMIAPARALMLAAYILIFLGFRPSKN
ncbi:MAG: hypothetical protein JW776_08970 [Candidatus Lokiarchaeota archaeon]|nr:hypothetical protein [Candidatus Lokiarchaeota archaeon]